MVRGLANRHLQPEFRVLWSRGPAIPWGDIHKPFTDAFVKYSLVSYLNIECPQIHIQCHQNYIKSYLVYNFNN